jgi:RNA polymerase sigma factor (TIGR02999 family)
VEDLPAPDVTLLLDRASSGDRGAKEELAAALYEELRRVARGQLRHERANHTLQATALVSEAWMRLAGDGLGRAGDRNEFLRHAARAMRSVLIDYARRRGAAKRGGGQPIAALEDELAVWQENNVDVLDLEACLVRLEAKDEQLAHIVELRFFAGLSEAETGEVLGLSRRQVQHAWTLARAWMHRELEGFREPEGA